MRVSRRLFYFILFLPIALLVGLRGATPDTAVYYNLFKDVDSYDLKNYYNYYLESGVELGWGLYSKIIIQFTDNSAILFSLFSALIFYFIYKTTDILKLNYLHTLVFYIPTGYFFMQQFMQIRQAFSVSVAIYASLLLLNNKFAKSLIFFILAFLFHQMSLSIIIISLIYYFVSRNIDVSKSLFLFRLYNFLIIFLGFLVIEFILKNYVIGQVSRLEAYSETNEYGKSVGFFSPANIKNYLLFIIFMALTNEKLIANKNYVFLFYIFTIGLTIRIGFYDFAILSGRLSNVFLYVEIFLLPFIFNSRFKVELKYFLMLIYFLLIISITWFFQASEYLETSYFEKVN